MDVRTSRSVTTLCLVRLGSWQSCFDGRWVKAGGRRIWDEVKLVLVRRKSQEQQSVPVLGIDREVTFQPFLCFYLGWCPMGKCLIGFICCQQGPVTNPCLSPQWKPDRFSSHNLGGFHWQKPDAEMLSRNFEFQWELGWGSVTELFCKESFRQVCFCEFTQVALDSDIKNKEVTEQ